MIRIHHFEIRQLASSVHTHEFAFVAREESNFLLAHTHIGRSNVQIDAALCVTRMNHGIGFSFQNAVDAQRIFAK